MFVFRKQWWFTVGCISFGAIAIAHYMHDYSALNCSSEVKTITVARFTQMTHLRLTQYPGALIFKISVFIFKEKHRMLNFQKALWSCALLIVNFNKWPVSTGFRLLRYTSLISLWSHSFCFVQDFLFKFVPKLILKKRY